MSKLGAVPTYEESLRQTERSIRRNRQIGGIVVVGMAVFRGIAWPGPLWFPLLLGAGGLAMIVWPSPVILGKKEREELEQRARSDLGAAKQLRKLLQDDLKGEGAMKRNLDKMAPPEMREPALRMIEQREQDLQARLLDLQATIEQLKG